MTKGEISEYKEIKGGKRKMTGISIKKKSVVMKQSLHTAIFVLHVAYE